MRKIEEENKKLNKTPFMSKEKYEKRRKAINKLFQNINNKIQENHRLGRSGNYRLGGERS